MSKNKKRIKPQLVEPSVIDYESYGDFLVESHFGEFDVQLTADTENEYPFIAHGYPITGFKDLNQNKEY